MSAGSQARGEAGQARRECSPCGGTGKVRSALGGTTHDMPCPWCGGSGVFQAGRDAQQASAELLSSGSHKRP